jgi:hypothetical protein
MSRTHGCGRTRLYAAALVLAACTSCSFGPSDSRVRADFLREHPTFIIEDIGAGEGDGGAVYYHIRYRKPGDDQVHEDVWQYLNTGEKVWKLNHKETLEKPLGR